MAAARIRKFTSIDQMEFFLRGGLLGSRSVIPKAHEVGATRSAGGGIVGLVGTTLTMTTPLLNVTFTAATLDPAETRDPNILMVKDIKAQIEAAQSALEVTTFDGRIGIIEKTPSGGLLFAAADEPARTLLGFPNNQDVQTRVYNRPGGADPTFEAYNAQENVHVLFTWE